MLLAASQLLLAASAAGYAGSTARHTSSRKHAAASPASFAVAAAGAQSLPVLSAGTVSGTSAPGMGLWQNGEPARLGPSGPSEFQLNLGRAIDTLRVDHPRLFTHPPDLSIFTEGIELHDVSGAKLRGKAQYERVFGMLRFLRRAAMQHAELTHRLVVHDHSIRMRWTAKLWMRDPALDFIPGMGSVEAKLVYMDGVSVYELDVHGFIRTHRLENVAMRDLGEASTAASREFSALLGLSGGHYAEPEVALPFLGAALAAFATEEEPELKLAAADAGAALSRLLHTSKGRKVRRGGEPMASASMGTDESPMQRAARERAEDAAAKSELAARNKRDSGEKAKRSFTNPFGSVGPTPCESSYDCDAPLVCCDLIVASVCCGGGIFIPQRSPQQRMQEQLIPIPVERDEPRGRGMPPNYPGPRGGPDPRYPQN